jgi:hypothetical protein
VSPRTIACALIALSSLAGCYTCYTTALEKPIPRELNQPESFSNVSGGPQSATIGDVLFTLRRYVTGAYEEIAVPAPNGLRPFPSRAAWFHSHDYNGPDGEEIAVYTSPDYYHGTMGVMLDRYDKLITARPHVQLAGVKSGRRWQMAAGKEFFVVPTHLIEAWGLRYGGRKQSDYVFEIIDRSSPTVVQILQSIQLSPTEWGNGVTVKGILIKGLPDPGDGTIQFTLEDRRPLEISAPPSRP